MIDIRGFSKRYESVCAVDDLTLKVDSGEVVALFGPNGSGKSTTLKALAGLIAPTAGTLTIGETSMAPAEVEARALIGYAPQQAIFDEHMRVDEVLRLHAGLRQIPFSTMLSCAERFGVESFLDRSGRELSGGQMQKVALAIALAGDPPVWLLDEPTAGLDHKSASDLRQMIRAHAETGGLVVLSTHMMQDLEALAHRVALMHEGRLLAIRNDSEVRQAVSENSLLVIDMLNPHSRFTEIASTRGATAVSAVNGTLEIAAAAEVRLDIMDALQEAGARFERFAVQPPSIVRLVDALTNRGGNE